MKIVEFLIGWLTSVFIERTASNYSHPIIVYAGLGDSVLGDNMKDFMAMLAERYKTDVYGINIADSEQEDRKLSGLSDANYNVGVACEKLQDLSYLGNVNAVGFSQGGLFLRAIIEQCSNIPQFKNLVTFGTPHLGIEKLPTCKPRDWVCLAVSLVTKWGVYTDSAQSHAVVAQYYRDPVRYATYLDKSTWLADLNNERILLGEEYDATYGDNLASLDGLTAVMFNKDTVVNPKESAWFGSSPVSSHYQTSENPIIPLEEQPIFLHPKDPLGLRRLAESQKLHFRSCDGDHLNLKDDCLWPILDEAFK
ncbi:alpha/beta-hydrolase [Wallemia mellicola]|nr:alpha/beta-hydrolase [Wallemia mellicola]